MPAAQALEEFSPWARGRGRVSFAIIPDDFDTNGPHRLILQARVRTVGLTDHWQIEPPHAAFTFEFDPRLDPSAILALPDSVRDEQIAQAITLQADAQAETGQSIYLPLGSEWTLRNPPRLVVVAPLACDLAHSISVELEGALERFGGGRLVISGQGGPRETATPLERAPRAFDLGPVAALPPATIERPGWKKMRVWLEPDPDCAWADPAIRSLWPGRTQTNWVEVEIVRR